MNQISQSILAAKLARRFTVLIFFGCLILFMIFSTGCENSVESKRVAPSEISGMMLEAAVGVPYECTLTVSCDPPPVFRLIEAPEGMTIDSVTVCIMWEPDSSSDFDNRVTVEVSNSAGTVNGEFMVQVAGLQIDGWVTGGLASENIDVEVIRNVAAGIEDGGYPGINSFLIVRDGKLVFENYFNGTIRNMSENIYSAPKSITSCLMGIAIDEGYIADENELLYPFFAEYDSFEHWTARKDSISLKHLITMTAGFQLAGDDYDIWLNNTGPRDWIKFYLDLPVVTSPGAVFNYESLCDRLAGHVVEREAGTTLPLFALEHLFEPLGMRYYSWAGWKPTTSSMISGFLELRPIDMAKIGQMYLDGGVWQGTRIVSQDWIVRSTAVNREDYGYNWWIYTWATPAGNYRVYFAYGNGGNSIYVVASLNMVVVFTGDNFERPIQWDQQYELMKQEIIPAAAG